MFESVLDGARCCVTVIVRMIVGSVCITSTRFSDDKVVVKLYEVSNKTINLNT
jgi:hypothetical protein